ncbi:hypothetical protein K461DRAFT_293947 [Myriangium duriaei CBS 260.36]|uniref:TIGR00297 family protein n=1 Tax=Myriangium duriaei CBS 260.36 TaxID=1168546 RepID=A0A9P4J4I4_9PEZI|nr:hypothetical protein K461DRAFT_293947 [Myriangium duriaei CBS 260.36]
MESTNPLRRPTPLLITTLLVLYSHLRHKLTLPAILLATFTSLLHSSTPSSLPFWSLILFFALGTIATRIGHAAKSHLTLSATGGSGAEGARNAAQVLANSGAASIFIILGLWGSSSSSSRTGWTAGKVDVGVAAAYAAAAADTLSSELGILARGQPLLITQPWRRVPRGTNGGVTLLGLAAGGVGGVALAGLHYAHYRDGGKAGLVSGLGLVGTVVDSLLGAVAQRTVEDKKSGRVVEGANGRRVMVGQGEGSRVGRGRDWLNNNGVNFTMTLAIGVVGLLLA